MQKLRHDRVACALVDPMAIGSLNITAKQWYYGLMDRLIGDLELKEVVDLQEFWDRYQNLSPLLHLREFVDTVLLKQITTPIVIFIDLLTIGKHRIYQSISRQYTIDYFDRNIKLNY